MRLSDEQLRELLVLEDTSVNWPPSTYTIRAIVEELLARRAAMATEAAHASLEWGGEPNVE